jgi:hypothetical protein
LFRSGEKYIALLFLDSLPPNWRINKRHIIHIVNAEKVDLQTSGYQAAGIVFLDVKNVVINSTLFLKLIIAGDSGENIDLNIKFRVLNKASRGSGLDLLFIALF